MTVAGKISQIKSEIGGGITLVAVSKTKPNDLIMEAYNAGQRDFGENYVQEMVSKHEALPKDIRWHFIGHLQSNKVRQVAPFVHLIHGVDSLKLLREINKEGRKNSRVIDCLFQMYIASEETKFGLSYDECRLILKSEELKNLTHIKLKGFMAMASNTDNKEQIRNEFSALTKFFSEFRQQWNLEYLSIGMSSDYKIALEWGGNMLRIGSTIFGERNYSGK